jgi:hypothetical protein
VFGEVKQDRSWQGWWSMMLDDESISHDTLAVLERSGTRIQFVVSKAVTLDGKDYKVLLWDDDYMLIGLADEFLNSEFDSKIVSDIIRELDELEPAQVDQEEYVRERSKELLIDALENIIDALILTEDVPTETTNIDILIDKLLEED